MSRAESALAEAREDLAAARSAYAEARRDADAKWVATPEQTSKVAQTRDAYQRARRALWTAHAALLRARLRARRRGGRA